MFDYAPPLSLSLTRSSSRFRRMRRKTTRPWLKFGCLLIGHLGLDMVVSITLEERRDASSASAQGDADCMWKDVKPQIAKTDTLLQAGKIAHETAESAVGMCDVKSHTRRHPWSHHHNSFATSCAISFSIPAEQDLIFFLRDSLISQPASAAKTTSPNSQPPPSQTRHEVNFSTRVIMLALQNHCADYFLYIPPHPLNQQKAISFPSSTISALLIYASWWYKPLNIHSPTVLPGGEAWKIYASMCVTRNRQEFWNPSLSRRQF